MSSVCEILVDTVSIETNGSSVILPIIDPVVADPRIRPLVAFRESTNSSRLSATLSVIIGILILCTSVLSTGIVTEFEVLGMRKSLSAVVALSAPALIVPVVSSTAVIVTARLEAVANCRLITMKSSVSETTTTSATSTVGRLSSSSMVPTT